MPLKGIRDFPRFVFTKGVFSCGVLDMKCIFFPLGDANIQISTIAEELAKKTEDASRQQEEITHLLSQIVDLQKKAKSVSSPHYIQ